MNAGGVTLNFDASQVAPQTSLDPIPAGWYTAIVDESDMKMTKDQSGAYLQLRFNIIAGQFAGRKVFARLNLQNNNQQARDIAHGQLSAICHAIGVLQVGNSQQLHGQPLDIKVTYQPADGQYEANNQVRGFRKVGATDAGPAALAGGMPPAMPGMPQGGQAIPQTQMQPQMPVGMPAGGQPAQPWQQPGQQGAGQPNGAGGGQWQQPGASAQPAAPTPSPNQPSQQPWQQQPQGQPWQQPGPTPQGAPFPNPNPTQPGFPVPGQPTFPMPGGAPMMDPNQGQPNYPMAGQGGPSPQQPTGTATQGGPAAPNQPWMQQAAQPGAQRTSDTQPPPPGPAQPPHPAQGMQPPWHNAGN